MKLTIEKENSKSITLSNGDQVYRGYGMYKDKWLIASKKREKKAEEYHKNNPHGVFMTSWFLKATNKKDSLKEYQSKTGNVIV